MKEKRFMENMKADMERKAALKRLVKMEKKMQQDKVRWKYTGERFGVCSVSMCSYLCSYLCVRKEGGLTGQSHSLWHALRRTKSCKWP